MGHDKVDGEVITASLSLTNLKKMKRPGSRVMTSNGPPPHEQAKPCISDSSSDKVSSSSEEDSSEKTDKYDALTVTTAVDGDVMKILSCSTDFACTFGPSVCGENLADWVTFSEEVIQEMGGGECQQGLLGKQGVHQVFSSQGLPFADIPICTHSM